MLEASVKVNPAYLPAVYGGFITIARTAGAAAMFIDECHFYRATQLCYRGLGSRNSVHVTALMSVVCACRVITQDFI